MTKPPTDSVAEVQFQIRSQVCGCHKVDESNYTGVVASLSTSRIWLICVLYWMTERGVSIKASLILSVKIKCMNRGRDR